VRRFLRESIQVIFRLKISAAILSLYLALRIAGWAADGEIIFAGYNLQNYLRMERREEGRTTVSPKPEKEIEALVRIIKEINPDILGVCEMGAPEEFEDFKKRLQDAGMGYTDFEYVQGPDPERRLALASRYPIVSRQSRAAVPFVANGAPEKVRRGFLDVTVKIRDGVELRFVGAHLKSKLAVPEGDALLRRNEAHLLRKHAEEIMAGNPRVRLVVYGDLNDTKNEPSIREIMGPRQSPDRLYDLWLKDRVGDRWTHYWKFADLYERIDYILVNARLIAKIDHSKSGVYRAENWNDASDHRPVVAAIRVADE
jgi:endonuclease/exonuclease/phosphatase family metal-dependent hydrolase